VKKAQKIKKQQKGVCNDVDIIASKLCGGDKSGATKKTESLLTDTKG